LPGLSRREASSISARSRCRRRQKVQPILRSARPGASEVAVGQNLTYTIVVSNLGSSAAQSVSLTDAIPTDTTFVSATQTAGPSFTLTKPAVGGTGTFTATIGSFASGGSATFRLVVHVDSTAPVGGEIENFATVSPTDLEPEQQHGPYIGRHRRGAHRPAGM